MNTKCSWSAKLLTVKGVSTREAINGIIRVCIRFELTAKLLVVAGSPAVRGAGTTVAGVASCLAAAGV